MELSVDIELTNRCNAKCHFCPRDQTPHEGLMSPEVFDQSLARAVEYRDVAAELLDASVRVSLCGLGEPLLNRHAPECVSKVRDAGFDVAISSNGSLLDERRGRALLDAGLQKILINVGDEGDEYEQVYQLPFDKTRDNVARFAQMAEGRCEVHVVLVDHHRDTAHIEKMKGFWRGYGINHFYTYGIMNRGGALFVDHMQYESLPQLEIARERLEARGGSPVCGAPFGYLFIGYDGQYYLCCSDWKKETPMGSVFDESFLSVTGKKLQYVVTREPVCKTCNLDPLNKLTDELRAIDAGEAEPADGDAVMASVLADNAIVHDLVARLGSPVPEPGSVPGRRYIPVEAS
jgi:MoaA/NifB/PqqE/SkfB family radical SAM enzyme